MQNPNRALIISLILGFIANIVASQVYPKGLLFLLTVLLTLCIVLWFGLSNPQPKSEREKERLLLGRVRDSWIASLTELKRLSPAGALLNLSYSLRVANSDPIEKSSITDGFELAGRSLLILGPGASGKTVSALVLTKHLVDHAMDEPGDPLPIFLSLSSWNDRYENVEVSKKNELRETATPLLLEPWLLNELKLKYGLAEPLAQSWLLNGRLLLILDGLDEVEADNRSACVKAIDEFVDEVKPPGIVVSSRDDGGPMPRLRGLLAINKLSTDQIRSYSNETLAPQKDPSVAQLGSSPLGLTLMLKIDKNKLPQNGKVEDLLDAFIATQLALAGRTNIYSRDQVLRSLCWLARRLDKYRQAIFHIEGVQPSWLPSVFWYVLLSRLLATIVVMMLGWIVMLTTNLAFAQFLPPEKVSFGLQFVTNLPLDWLFISIVFGGGLAMALPDYLRFRQSENEKVVSGVKATLTERGDIKNIFVNVFMLCLPIFFCGAMLMRLFWSMLGFGSTFFDFSLHRVLSGATIYAISFGLVFWFRGIGRSAQSDIHTAEKITFTRTSFLKGAGWGALAGLILGVAPAALVGYKYGWLHGSQGWISGIQFWPISLFIGFIVGGVTSGLGKVSVIEKTYPNQGVWLSLRNTVLIWLVVGGSSSIVIWLYAIGFLARPTATFHDAAATTLQDAVFLGAVVGMLVGFAFGGLDVVYHIALRVLIRAYRLAPLIRLRNSLDYGSGLGFLRKVGGGYMFLHGSLRKQFEESTDPVTKGLPPSARARQN